MPGLCGTIASQDSHTSRKGNLWSKSIVASGTMLARLMLLLMVLATLAKHLDSWFFRYKITERAVLQSFYHLCYLLMSVLNKYGSIAYYNVVSKSNLEE